MGNFPSVKLLPRLLEFTRPPTKHTAQKKSGQVQNTVCSDLTISSVLNLAPCSSGTEIVFQSRAGVLPSAAGNLFELWVQLS